MCESTLRGTTTTTRATLGILESSLKVVLSAVITTTSHFKAGKDPNRIPQRTTTSMAATTKFTLLGSSATSLNGPSQPPIISSLSFQNSSTPKLIRLLAKHFPEVRVIVRCGADDDSNYYWGNGGGGGGGSGGDGEKEGEAEEERFQELPMLGWPLSSKDQEVDGWLGWEEMMVQLYGFEFDDGFSADDIFSIKNASEYQKHEEKVLKVLEIAEDEMRFKANSMMKPVQIGEKHPGDTQGEEF